MHGSPFALDILFHVGPVPISRAVVTTWGIMAVLTLVSWLGTRRAARGGTLAAVLEILVETLEDQIHGVLQRDVWRYLPMLATLFIFLVAANLSPLIPGVKPPTAHIETPAALAIIVFFSVHVFGISARGVGGYFKRFLHPSPILLPLNILAEFTRIVSLMVRLFGNMMSHEFVIAIVLFLAGFLMPIPFMLLGILVGVIQAYIFTILATVYIGAGIGAVET